MSFLRRSTASTKAAKENAPPATSEIYATPPAGTVPTKKWEYDEKQLAQIAELEEYTSTLLLPEDDEYHKWEKRFLSDVGTHPRFMRAAKWKTDDAKKRIKGTIEWRREFRPELIEPEDVAIEAETGKIILTGFDKDARPIIYMRPSRENTETSPRQIRHLIFCLERAIDLMPPGQEQVAIVVDYKSATSSSTPSISTGLKVLNILQHHYVERLGRGLVVNMPWWINAFFSGISPFMDPITRDKIRFNPTLTELIDPAQLDYEYGGQYNLDFNKDVYWSTITDFCRLAPNGGRLDPNGNEWVPPSGNGIKWAVDNHGAEGKGEQEPEAEAETEAETENKSADASPAAQEPNNVLSSSSSTASNESSATAVTAETGLENQLAKTAIAEQSTAPAAVTA